MHAGPEEISQAVVRLKTGGLVAFPTETVYGLGADAMSTSAVERVFAAKGRPSTNPLIVHVSSEEMAASVTASWPKEAQKLANAFWPGPLSIVLPKGQGIPKAVTASGPNIAVRCPDHPLTLALIEAFGGPLVGPSANPSGRVSPTTADHVREAFTQEQVMVLDGGACRAGIESTVISLAGKTPRVLRPGLVTIPELARALGKEVESGVVIAQAVEAMESPGQLAQHYAPQAKARLFDAKEWPELLDDMTEDNAGLHVVLTPRPRDVPNPHVKIAMPADARGYATRIYAALREADEASPALIAIERPDASGTDGELWRAILDRLVRATA